MQKIAPRHSQMPKGDFEFEFVVNDYVGAHKIFNNLVIISNNVQPNELEFEIEGDVFNFNKAGIFRDSK